MLKKSDKRGQNILTENIIFIILNLVFVVILVIFIVSKMGGPARLEETYAKEIALLIDSAQPHTLYEIDMADAFKVAKKQGYTGEIVTTDGNQVTVRLRQNGGYTYSFFNDVVVIKPQSLNKPVYKIAVGGYK